VEQYNPSTKSWALLASLPVALSGLSTVSDGSGHVFAVGGIDAQGNLSSTVCRYTIAIGRRPRQMHRERSAENG
jgi:hypothetical protein